jgi:hypothetical protein
MAMAQAFHVGAAALIALSAAGETLAQSAGGQVAQQQPIIELRLAREAPAPGFVRMEFLGRQGGVYVAERSIVSDDGIEKVGIHPRADQLLLDVHFAPAAAARLSEATREGVGRLQIAVLIESRLAAAAPIASPVGALGRVTIGLELPPRSIEAVAARIAARWPQ